MDSIGIIWHEWFQEPVQNAALSDLKPLLGFYRRNNILKITALKWIREKLYDTYDGEIEQEELRRVKMLWAKKIGCDAEDWESSKEASEYIEKNYLNYKEVDNYFMREAAANSWAISQWEKITPQLFLAKKENYDIVNAELITTSKENKNLMREIYYCLKDEGATIGEIISKKKDMTKGTKKPINIRISEMNNVLKYYVGRANIGKYYGPIPVDDNLMIFRVLEKQQGVLTENIKRELCNECMRKFLDYGSDMLCDFLCDPEE